MLHGQVFIMNFTSLQCSLLTFDFLAVVCNFLVTFSSKLDDRHFHHRPSKGENDLNERQVGKEEVDLFMIPKHTSKTHKFVTKLHGAETLPHVIYREF